MGPDRQIVWNGRISITITAKIARPEAKMRENQHHSAARKAAARPLVIHKLEKVSKGVFRQYYGAITELIGHSPGVYALYDGDELYYVGKSTELRSRVKQHLRDGHLASWTHFSLFLVRKAEHIQE